MSLKRGLKGINVKEGKPTEFRIGIKTRIFNWSLDRAIRAKGWTRPQTAKACGVSMQTLFSWLRFQRYPKENKKLEVSVALGVPDEILFPEEIQGLRIESQPEPVSFGKEEAMVMNMLSPEVNPEQLAIEGSLRDTLQEMMEGLTEREKLVLKIRFGFDGEGYKTYDECASSIGVTRERIRQIEYKALKKLRLSSLVFSKLRDFWVGD